MSFNDATGRADEIITVALGRNSPYHYLEEHITNQALKQQNGNLDVAYEIIKQLDKRRTDLVGKVPYDCIEQLLFRILYTHGYAASGNHPFTLIYHQQPVTNDQAMANNRFELIISQLKHLKSKQEYAPYYVRIMLFMIDYCLFGKGGENDIQKAKQIYNSLICDKELCATLCTDLVQKNVQRFGNIIRASVLTVKNDEPDHDTFLSLEFGIFRCHYFKCTNCNTVQSTYPQWKTTNDITSFKCLCCGRSNVSAMNVASAEDCMNTTNNNTSAQCLHWTPCPNCSLFQCSFANSTCQSCQHDLPIQY